MAETRSTARVLFFDKTFGFIRDIETGKELYVNFKSIIEEANGQFRFLKPGEIVEYESNKNRTATKVLRVNNKDRQGRDIVFVKLFLINRDSDIDRFSNKIKIEHQLRNLYKINKLMIGTDSKLTPDDIEKIHEKFMKEEKTKRKGTKFRCTFPLQLKDKVIFL